jgi:acetyl/propionyl-CoA carboxylase alpha subunit
MPYEMLLNEQDISLDILARRPDLKIKSGDKTYTVFEMPSDGAEFEIEIDGEYHSGHRYVSGDEVYVRIGTRTFIVGLPQASLRAHSQGKTGDALHADMPGTVISLHTRDGVVEAIHVPAETAFDRGALLISLAPLAAPEAAPSKS